MRQDLCSSQPQQRVVSRSSPDSRLRLALAAADSPSAPKSAPWGIEVQLGGARSETSAGLAGALHVTLFLLARRAASNQQDFGS